MSYLVFARKTCLSVLAEVVCGETVARSRRALTSGRTSLAFPLAGRFVRTSYTLPRSKTQRTP